MRTTPTPTSRKIYTNYTTLKRYFNKYVRFIQNTRVIQTTHLKADNNAVKTHLISHTTQSKHNSQPEIKTNIITRLTALKPSVQ